MKEASKRICSLHTTSPQLSMSQHLNPCNITLLMAIYKLHKITSISTMNMVKTKCALSVIINSMTRKCWLR